MAYSAQPAPSGGARPLAGGMPSLASASRSAAAAASLSDPRPNAAETAQFRAGRNDLAATLKAGSNAMGVESRSSQGGRNSATSPLPVIPTSQGRVALQAQGQGPSPPASAYGTKPGTAASGSSSLGASKPGTAGRDGLASAGGKRGTSSGGLFPSTDKGGEESKEQGAGSASASAAGSIGAATKDKDWNLWHGAVEAQWILSVLDDIQNKLTLSSFLSSDILKDPICDSLDPEMLLTLREHFQVENQYHEFLDSELWKLNATEAKNQELFHELDLCLADSTRTVTRLLKQNPLLVRRMREVAPKRNPASLDFINTFGRLRQLMHHKLRMTAEEERHMREQLAELQALEEEDTLKFIELTERLAVERNEHEQALSSKDRKIQRLTTHLSQLQARTAQEKALFESKMREDGDAAEKAFRQSEKELSKQLEELTKQLEVDSNLNFHAELQYHRKKNLRALDVTNLIEKYDVDMTLKHESVVDMEAVYVKERKELDALNGYFSVRDAEDLKIRLEHEKIRNERDAELKVERRTQQASILVSGLYKSYYAKNGPKEPKAKKAKKKKDPYAGLRSRPRTSKPAEEAPASASAAPGSAMAGATHQQSSDLGPSPSPASSGPEDSDGEKTAGEAEA